MEKRIRFACRMAITTFVLLATACTSNKVESDSDGVTIRLEESAETAARLLRLDVVTPAIIRVQATPEKSWPKCQKSLMIAERQHEAVPFSISEQGDSLWIATDSLKVLVNSQTGRIAFFDHQGTPLLNEVENDGKTFAPMDDAWSWRALFESDSDEGFYGLGQHQSGELNMKGLNEELFQYNTKISVPFVVSTKGYGLLWDSYSLCRWGNPADYHQLADVFKMEPLKGIYINKEKDMSVTRDEDSLYFEHLRVIPNLPKDFPLKGAEVTYEGTLEAPETADYNFILYYAGYTRVLLDGKEVVPERWRTAWNPNAWKFTARMEKGRKTPLRVEWKPDGDVSYIGLRVAEPRTADEQGQLSVWSEMSRKMDYYFIYGSNFDKVISGYRTLTGKAQVMPKWAMGFWQSRERYQSEEEILQALAEFRRRHIPVDNMVQDWFYWQEDQWGSHQFDPERYPTPQAMLDSIHNQHARYMISVWPKFYCNTDNYKELDAQGWMYRQAVTDSIRDWVGEGHLGSFYDAYADGARDMFWRQINDNLYTKYDQAVDAWWMDASEPNVRDCTPIDYRKDLCGPTALGSSAEYFNAYALVNAMAIYDGQRSVNPDKRVFLLTRSGFAGLQRYSTASWSGDIGTRWEDMRAQMTAGMNYSMSGIPFWGMDIGGFCVEDRYVRAQQIFDQTGVENADLKEWRELQARWNQFGCFVPLYRTHGQWPAREVWNIAPETHPCYQSIVWYDRLRYCLMPYLYSMAGWVNRYDYTPMRALVMDFTADKEVYDIKDQWMFGPSLMACPVGEYGARSRTVYLPAACGWYDLYTGTRHEGGQRIAAAAPYERIPVFVPEGAIIPFGPEMEWSDQHKPEVINLYVYTGRDARFTLYEDEGVNYNYEQGAFAEIPITYCEADGTLTIGEREGRFDGMLERRQFNVVVVSPDKRRALDFDNPEGIRTDYHGEKVTLRLKPLRDLPEDID